MAQIDTDKEYLIKYTNDETYMTVVNNAVWAGGQTGGINFVALTGDANQSFTFEASGDGYKLKDKTGHYITCWEWNVGASTSNADEAAVLFFESAGNDEYYIKWNNTYKNDERYFKIEHVLGANNPYGDATLSNAAKFALVENFGRQGYVHNTGNLNRGDRGLTSFTITDGTNSLEVTDIQTSSTAPVYVDKSAQKFTTTAGATLSFSAFNYTGSWMHAYAYVDYNNDWYFTLEDNNDGTNDGEVVSYNYYGGNTITGASQNMGNAMSSEYDGSKTLPAFTLPANLEPGEYRMRIKVDWDNKDADKGASDIAQNGGCQCDITIVVVPSYELSVGQAGWATLFLDFAAAIPADAEVYTVTEVNSGYVTLTQVTGVLPANTGVIVKANKGAYDFVSSADEAADVAGNLLQGTVAATEIETAAYVLGIVNGEVGLYKAAMNGGVWLNNAYKAYLPASVANGAANFSFRFEGGTTGIANVEVENAGVIYDLTGRKVDAVERGIYIINGKKVLVK